MEDVLGEVINVRQNRTNAADLANRMVEVVKLPTAASFGRLHPTRLEHRLTLVVNL